MRRLTIGTAGRMAVGESASADRCVVRQSGSVALLAVLDGLGHGDQAIRAALAAVSSLEAEATTGLTTMVERVNEQLRGTRGVVISMALVDLEKARLTWIGVGNVAGLVVHRGATTKRCESLLSTPGIVGANLPTLRETTVPFDVGDTLVFATDGLHESFVDSVAPGVPVQRQADQLLARHGQQRDDCLVLVACLVEDDG